MNAISPNGEYLVYGTTGLYFHRIGESSHNRIAEGFYGSCAFQDNENFWCFLPPNQFRQFRFSDGQDPVIIEEYTSSVQELFDNIAHIVMSPFEDAFYFGAENRVKPDTSLLLRYQKCDTESIETPNGNVGAIIGGVVGAVVGIALLASLVVYFLLYRRRKQMIFLNSADSLNMEVDDEWTIPFDELEMKESIGKGNHFLLMLTKKELLVKCFELSGAMQMWQ